MFNILEFDPSVLTASVVLIVMGCVSLAFSFTLRRKSKALSSYPENVEAKVFKKTFNVFDPYPERRRTVEGHIELLILFAVYGSFIVIGYAIAKIFETGFLLGFLTLIVCIGFLLIDETLELYKSARIFVKAIRKGVDFGKGDVEALHLIRKTLPKLSVYHLALAIVFFASSVTLPYIVNTLAQALVQVAAAIFMVSFSLRFFPPLVLLFTSLLFAGTAAMVLFAAGKVKTRVFSFSSPERLDALADQFYRMKMFTRILHHHPQLHVPEFEEPKKADEQEVEETES